MKKIKKSLAVAAIAAIGCIAGVYGLQNSEKESKSALTIANVEALSGYESAYGCPDACIEWSGSNGGGIACDCGRYIGKCKRRCP